MMKMRGNAVRARRAVWRGRVSGRRGQARVGSDMETRDAGKMHGLVVGRGGVARNGALRALGMDPRGGYGGAAGEGLGAPGSVRQRTGHPNPSTRASKRAGVMHSLSKRCRLPFANDKECD